MTIQDRWNKTLCYIGGRHILSADICWHRVLLSGYSEKGRFYHNMSHIEACFNLLDSLNVPANPALELAIWFHDIVYDPRGQNNEIKSAIKLVNTINMDNDIITDAVKMIIISDHKSIPVTSVEKLFCDIDLSILGEESDVYNLYNSQIREEYKFVPDDIYNIARTDILKKLRNRALDGDLFHTPVISSKYNTNAIMNLGNSIRNLK